jgi:A/G-specific adenine glycosylase
MKRSEFVIKKKLFVRKILKWYSNAEHIYPWRMTRDPYRILISEMLLRKTTRLQVSSIFKRFFDRYPTFAALALAKRSDVRRIIQPLGMENRRSELLIRLAKSVVSKHEGILKLQEKALLELPGVGKYTANATLCLSKNMRLPMVDTNAIRLLERIFSYKSTKKRAATDDSLWRFTSSLMPKKHKEFNLALLDFAATVCLPKKPKCNICPINTLCDFYNDNRRTPT